MEDQCGLGNLGSLVTKLVLLVLMGKRVVGQGGCLPQLSDRFFVGCHGPREEEDNAMARGCTGSCFCREE